VFLALLALVAMMAAPALAGCGDGDVTTTTTGLGSSETTGASTTIVSETTTVVSETSTTLPSATTTTEKLSSAEASNPDGTIKAMGYIDKVWESGGVRYISIDYAEMLTGAAANAAAVAAGEIAPGEDVPNDYFIQNTNTQKRQFAVARHRPGPAAWIIPSPGLSSRASGRPLPHRERPTCMKHPGGLSVPEIR
jgi:hypothetical protein